MVNVLDLACFSFAKPSKPHNEDALLAPSYDNNSNVVFAISDGVGSHVGAEQASYCAINAVRKTLENDEFLIEDAFIAAKYEIDNMSQQKDEYSNSAATLTIVQVSEHHIHIGHIGDCRAYNLRKNKLEQLTTDETRYQQLLESGDFSLRQLNKHKIELSSVLTNALSSQIDLDFKFKTYDVRDFLDKDKCTLNLILMSDGAYDHWHKRPRFSQSTMQSPSAFSNSLRKRIEKNPLDDYSMLNVKLHIERKQSPL